MKSLVIVLTQLIYPYLQCFPFCGNEGSDNMVSIYQFSTTAINHTQTETFLFTKAVHYGTNLTLSHNGIIILEKFQNKITTSFATYNNIN